MDVLPLQLNKIPGMTDVTQLALVGLAITLSWERFRSIFSGATSHTVLLAPVTSIATAVCVSGIGLSIWLSGACFGLCTILVSLGLATPLRKTGLNTNLSVMLAAALILLFLAANQRALL